MSLFQRLITQRIAIVSARFERIKQIVKTFRDYRRQKDIKLDARAQELQRIIEQLGRRSIAEHKNEDIPEPTATPTPTKLGEAIAPKNPDLVKCRPRANNRTPLDIRKNRSDQISAVNKQLMKMSPVGNIECLELPRACDKLLTELPTSAFNLQLLKVYEMCDRFERDTQLNKLNNITKIITDSRPGQSYIDFTGFLGRDGKRLNAPKMKRED